MRRTVIVVQKLRAMALQAIVLAAVWASSSCSGGPFTWVSLARVVSVSMAVLLLGLDFGIITMAVGALPADAARPSVSAPRLAAASYLVSSLAPVASWIRPARYVSLFFWSVGRTRSPPV